MKDQSNISHSTPADVDSRVESLLDACRPCEVDNSRIKSRVRAKILAYEFKRKARRRRIAFAWASAAACVILAMGIAMRLMSPAGIDLSSATLAQAIDAGYKELIVEPGSRADIILADGTRLVANSRTRVLYPERFTGAERRIYADGEVYLEVSKDPSKPFVVESNGFDIRVLGTVFNIRNNTDSTAEIVLVEGSVEVTTDRDSRIKMKPSDKLDLVKGEVSSLTTVDTSEYTLWVDGLLSLHGEQLADLARRLGEHYGVAIECDRSLADFKIYGKLDLRDSIDVVLTSIQEIVPMQIEKDADAILLTSR